MAKKYTNVGYISKGRVKDGKQMPDYIKVTNNVTLKEGSFLNLESKKTREEGIKYRLSQGWITEEQAQKQMEGLSKWADYKRFDIVLVEEA
jgi:hypothetical protein